jgi:hypothetical protein
MEDVVHKQEICKLLGFKALIIVDLLTYFLLFYFEIHVHVMYDLCVTGKIFGKFIEDVVHKQ